MLNQMGKINCWAIFWLGCTVILGAWCVRVILRIWQEPWVARDMEDAVKYVHGYECT